MARNTTPAAKRAKTKVAKADPAARAEEASLAQLIRETLSPRILPEKRMFGGTCFLMNGNMLCGTYKGDVIFRVGVDAHVQCLREPGASPFVMQGKALNGWIAVSGSVLDSPEAARPWVARAMLFVGGLPAK